MKNLSCLFVLLLGGCSSFVQVYESISSTGVALMNVVGASSQPIVSADAYEDMTDWTLRNDLSFSLRATENGVAVMRGELGALSSLLPGRLVDLKGNELAIGQTFTGAATVGADLIAAFGPSNATLTYVVDRYEKPKPGEGDDWQSPPFLTIVVAGDVPDGNVAATIELGLAKFTAQGCQNFFGCE